MRMGAALLAVAALVSSCTSGARAEQPTTPPAQRATVISVLGDSTGNDRGEWVDLWAEHLGQSRHVIEHTWSWKEQRWNPTPIEYGTGSTTVTIWNGSYPGATPQYALDRLPVILPKHADLIVLNYGHNGAADKTTAGLGALKAATDAPCWVILQNPGLTDHAAAQDRNLAAVKAWAHETHTRTIDVTTPFRKAGAASMMRDHAHPNAAGSALWASVVEKALG